MKQICGKIFNNINNIIFRQCKYKLHLCATFAPPFSSQICGRGESDSLKKIWYLVINILTTPQILLSTYSATNKLEDKLVFTSTLSDPYTYKQKNANMLIQLPKRLVTNHISFFKFLLLFNYSCMPFLPIPPPHPAEPTSLPHLHPNHIS